MKCVNCTVRGETLQACMSMLHISLRFETRFWWAQCKDGVCSQRINAVQEKGQPCGRKSHFQLDLKHDNTNVEYLWDENVLSFPFVREYVSSPEPCFINCKGHFSLLYKQQRLEQECMCAVTTMWGLTYNGICTFWSYVFSVPASEACWLLIHQHSQGHGVITKTYAVYKYEPQRRSALSACQPEPQNRSNFSN